MGPSSTFFGHLKHKIHYPIKKLGSALPIQKLFPNVNLFYVYPFVWLSYKVSLQGPTGAYRALIKERPCPLKTVFIYSNKDK